MIRPWHHKKNKEKGNALIIVTLISGVMLSLLGVYTKNEAYVNDIKSYEKVRVLRDQVAKDLLSQISNTEVIKEAISDDMANRFSGNKRLKACVEGMTPNGCSRDMREFILPSFLRVPQSDRGYNFSRELGLLSACYPLKPTVFFRPLCSQNAPTCTVPESIEVAYQLEHQTFSEHCPKIPKISPLGIYPKELNFIQLPTSTLKDYACNPGAYAMGYDGSGSLVCKCQFPYVPIPDKINSQGVLCKKISVDCPSGFLYTGRKPNGDPVCESLTSISKNYTKTMSMGTENATLSSSSTSISCGENGWLGDLKMSCTAKQAPTMVPGVGYSCLFLYAMVKFIDGKYYIPGMIPDVFYPTDDPKGCYALTEKPAMKGMSNSWDGICFMMIMSLLAADNVSIVKIFKNRAKMLVKPAITSVTKMGAEAAVAKATREASIVAAEKMLAKMSKEGVGGVGGSIVIGVGKKAKNVVVSAARNVRKSIQEIKNHLKTLKKGVSEKISKNVKQKLGSIAEKTGVDSLVQGVKGSDPFKALSANAQKLKETLAAAKKSLTKVKSKLDEFRTLEEATYKRWESLHMIAKISGSLGLRVMFSRLIKELAKEERQNEVIEKAKNDKRSVVDFFYEGLTAATIGQAVALEIAMAALGKAANEIRKIPIIGPPSYALMISLGSLLFTSWQIKVDYTCHPIKEPPQMSCELSGSCFEIEKSSITP